MQPSPSPHDSGLSIKDVLPYFLAFVAAALSWFAARSTAFAQLTKTVLDASRNQVIDSQALHAHDGALISEQAEKLRAMDLELLRKEGEIRQHLQQVVSISNALKREQARNKDCTCQKTRPKHPPKPRRSRRPPRPTGN